MRKLFIAGIVSGLMLALILTGCGGTDGGNETQNTAANSSGTPPASSGQTAQTPQIQTQQTNEQEQDWLVGVWSGKMPDAEGCPFPGVAVRLEITKAASSPIPFEANSVCYKYEGKFTWDTGGSNSWTAPLTMDDLEYNYAMWLLANDKKSEKVGVGAYRTPSDVHSDRVHMLAGPMPTLSSGSRTEIPFSPIVVFKGEPFAYPPGTNVILRKTS
jgi:hypothetical protein